MATYTSDRLTVEKAEIVSFCCFNGHTNLNFPFTDINRHEIKT